MSVRDTIRKSVPKVKPVTSPGGDVVYVRALSGAGRKLYTEVIEKQKANGGINNAQLICLGLCDESGALVYDWEKSEDVAELADIDGNFERQLLEALLEASGLTVKASENAEKN